MCEGEREKIETFPRKPAGKIKLNSTKTSTEQIKQSLPHAPAGLHGFTLTRIECPSECVGKPKCKGREKHQDYPGFRFPLENHVKWSRRLDHHDCPRTGNLVAKQWTRPVKMIGRIGYTRSVRASHLQLVHRQLFVSGSTFLFCALPIVLPIRSRHVSSHRQRTAQSSDQNWPSACQSSS